MTQFFSLLILVVSVLVAVAFFTLFERKLLGYIQLRSGPNKMGMVGLLQPFSDAIKLFCKEYISPQLSNFYPYIIAPVFALSLSLVGWLAVPLSFNLLSFEFSILFFLCCVGMGVYMLLAAGWSSNSKYSLLGGLRGVAQTISYEVSLVLILLGPMIFAGTFSWGDLSFWQMRGMFFFIMPLSFLFWFISCLAETNRTPFDFAEGESELVSGYNTEYGSSSFALLMLAEYTSILLMSMFTLLIFLSSTWFTNLVFFSLVAFTFVWVRGTLPRFRYDKLMTFAWTGILPYSLVWLTWIVGLMSMF